MNPLGWDNYLNPNQEVQRRREACGNSFKGQRERIRDLARALSPKTAVCMGAGHLNDIPIGDLIAGGSSVFLADWMRGVQQEAFLREVVQNVDGRFKCAICKNPENPREYCPNFSLPDNMPARREEDHCGNFMHSGGFFPLCANFQWGLFPRFLESDVTQGRAGHFAQRVAKAIMNARTPREVFKRACREARDCGRARDFLPVHDHSADLITSSMLVSQFDHEPYRYMSLLLAEKFGEQTIMEKAPVLTPLMQKLRDDLFGTQVEGHCREMARLLKPGGRVYFSVETFHKSGESGTWFPIILARQALAIIEAHFDYDFDALPADKLKEKIKILDGESMVECYVLAPKRPDADSKYSEE
ncbi:MAG: hypothetical protein HY579_09065 [Nitrospinae bacterium]|nr:hypothetical protein [Nitrospinota bacterium]